MDGHTTDFRNLTSMSDIIYIFVVKEKFCQSKDRIVRKTTKAISDYDNKGNRRALIGKCPSSF